MSALKGMDNFAKSREAQIEANLRLIEHFLEKQRKRRVSYPTLSSLVADISEATNLHRTTLTRRGSRYLKILLLHLAEQPGAASTVADKDASPELLKAKLLDARAEIASLKGQLQIVKAQMPVVPTETASHAVSLSKDTEEPDWYLAFADTAMAFQALVERLNENEETVRFDAENLTLLDLAANPRRKVIFSGDRLRELATFHKRLLQQKTGGL